MGFTNLFLILFSKRFRCVFLPKFEPTLFLSSIQKYKVATMTVPPPVVILLAKSPQVDEFNLSSLRLMLSGAAPLSRDIEEQIKARFNNKIKLFTGYGLSEANIVVYNIGFNTRTSGSVGDLMKAMHAKVIDENGKTMGVNKVGELCFKGPLVMKGYFRNAKATSETIDNDGWLHTGDLGYYDNNSQIFIVDRLKELIKYKGYQVAPAELEGLLLSHPKVKDVGVIGIPDETAGELPLAYIVKQQNVEITAEEVKDFVAKNASNPKRLRGGVKFINEIPKNPSGKILRRVLREFYKNTRAKL
jgi:4-coumarate--CoA ligase